MTERDFAEYGIQCCTAASVAATGADIADVDRSLLITLDGFRILSGQAVVLLKNGLTTGEHLSPEHAGGIAVDIAFASPSNELSVANLVSQAYYCGFRGVGVYWNGVALSMHLDLGNRWRRWLRVKQDDGTWLERALIVDPRA